MAPYSASGQPAMVTFWCLLAAVALGLGRMAHGAAPTCGANRVTTTPNYNGPCVEFTSAKDMREKVEAAVSAQASVVEQIYKDVKTWSREKVEACEYVESCDPDRTDPAWDAAKYFAQFTNPGTQTCSRRDWGDGSKAGNPMLKEAITGRDVFGNEGACSGYSSIGGADGLTKNTIFSNQYYTEKGCFRADVKTKCTVNPEKYGVNMPTGKFIKESPQAQSEVCATNALVNHQSGFKAVQDKYPEITWSFLGLQATGLFRNWPAIYQCRTESQCDGCSDSRFRGWYASAAAGPKDLILVMDRSGSMQAKGRLTEAQKAARWVINTLSYADYATIVDFSTDANTIGPMMPMHVENRARMKKYVNTMSAFGGTRLDRGIVKALDLLKEGKASGKTTNCESIILFLTDGKNTGSSPTALVREKAAELSVRIFTYHFGESDDTAGQQVMKTIACENSGVYYNVPVEGGNLKLIMASYFSFLAVGLIQGAQAGAPNPVLWAETYEDGQGLGQNTAACSPIYDRTISPPSLFGVMCSAMPSNTSDQWSDWPETWAAMQARAKVCRKSDLAPETLEKIRAQISPDATCAGFTSEEGDTSDDSAIDGAVIGGIVGGSVVFVLLLISLAVWLKKRELIARKCRPCTTCLSAQAPMVAVNIILLVGMAAITAVCIDAGYTSVGGLLRVLIDDVTSNAVSGMTKILEEPMLLNDYTAKALRRGELLLGKGHTERALKHFDEMNEISQYEIQIGTWPKQYVATVDPFGNKYIVGSALGTKAWQEKTGRKYIHTVMDETTKNAAGKDCLCGDYISETKTCAEEIKCGYNPLSRPWFARAQEAKTQAWTSIYADFTTGQPCMTSAVLTVDARVKNQYHVVAMDVVTEQFATVLHQVRNKTFVNKTQAENAKGKPSCPPPGGDTGVVMAFALHDGTILATTNLKDMNTVTSLSGDFRAEEAQGGDRLAAAVESLNEAEQKQGDNSTAAASSSKTSENAQEVKCDPKTGCKYFSAAGTEYFVSAQKFGAKSFGKDGFLMVLVPKQYYFYFIADGMYVTIGQAIVGTLILVAIAVYFRPVDEAILRRRSSQSFRQGITVQDIRDGVVVPSRERARLLSKMLNVVSSEKATSTSTLVASVIAVIILAQLLSTLIMWQTLFATSVDALVDSTMVNIQLKTQIRLLSVMKTPLMINRFTKFAIDEGYLQLSAATTLEQAQRFDTFFSDMHQVFHGSLQYGMRPALVSVGYGRPVLLKDQTALPRGYFEGARWDGTRVTALVKDSRSQALHANALLERPLVQYRDPNAIIDAVQGRLVRDPSVELNYLPGYDVHKAHWFKIHASCSPMNKLACASRWDDELEDLVGPKKSGSGYSTKGIMATMAGLVSNTNSSSSDYYVAGVQVSLDFISEQLSDIVFFKDDSPDKPSGVAYIVQRKDNTMIASSTGSRASLGVTKPGEFGAPAVGYTFSEFEMRKGALSTISSGALEIADAGVLDETGQGAVDSNVLREDADAKRYRIAATRIGPYSPCRITQSLVPGIDWVLFVALDRNVFLKDYGVRSQFSLLVTLAAVILATTLASLGLRSVLQKYEKRVKAADANTKAKQAVENDLRSIDPDSEDFFDVFKTLAAPVIARTNLKLRHTSKKEMDPPQAFLDLLKIVNSKQSAADLFKKMDKDGGGTITRDEFNNVLRDLGVKHVQDDAIQSLFDALDVDGGGTISYQEVIEGDPNRYAETAATYDERRRALDYVLQCARGHSLTELLQYEYSLQFRKRFLYTMYGNPTYTLFIGTFYVIHLGLAFIEAPAARIGLRQTEYHGNDWTRPNVTDVGVLGYSISADNHEFMLYALGLAVIVVQYFDLTFQVYLQGFREPMMGDVKGTDSDNQPVRTRSNTLFGLRRNSAPSSTNNPGCCSCIKFDSLKNTGPVRSNVVAHTVLLSLIAIDWIFQVSTHYTDSWMGPNKDYIMLIPISAVLRPNVFMLRFRSVGQAGTNLIETLFFGKDVLALFLAFMVISTTIGVVILHEGWYDSPDRFETLPTAIITIFIFLLTGENYPDVAYDSSDCNQPNLPQTDTLEGGVTSADCANWALHPVFWLFSMLGLFLVVALVIAVFEGFYGNKGHEQATARRKNRRLGIIAAFVLLDKDGGGSLDKQELLGFLNNTAGLSFKFEMDDELELHGIEFVELVESLVHLMHQMPEINPAKIIVPASLNVKGSDLNKQAPGGLWVGSFISAAKQTAKGFTEDLAGAVGGRSSSAQKRFSEAGPQELLDCLRMLDQAHGDDDNKIAPATISHEHLTYWRRFAADATLRYIHEQEEKAAHSHSTRSSCCSRFTRVLRVYLRKHGGLHDTIMMFLTFANIWLLTLYVQAEGSCVAVNASTAAGDNSGKSISGFTTDGCALDIASLVFVVIWILDVTLRVVAVGWKSFWFVNDDFYMEFRNRYDFMIVLAEFLAIIPMLVIYFQGTPDAVGANLQLRFIFCLPTLRLLSCVSMIREIFFSMLAILPQSKSVFALLALVMYMYNIFGLMLFNGRFRFLGENYEMAQANFNSFVDGFTTLFQLFVGAAWNEILQAAMDTANPVLVPFVVLYFFSYILIMTVVFSNLLIGVVISGYSNVIDLRNHMEDAMEDDLDADVSRKPLISARQVHTCIEEGDVGDPRLKLTYVLNDDGTTTCTISKQVDKDAVGERGVSLGSSISSDSPNLEGKKDYDEDSTSSSPLKSPRKMSMFAKRCDSISGNKSRRQSLADIHRRTIGDLEEKVADMQHMKDEIEHLKKMLANAEARERFMTPRKNADGSSQASVDEQKNSRLTSHVHTIREERPIAALGSLRERQGKNTNAERTHDVLSSTVASSSDELTDEDFTDDVSEHGAAGGGLVRYTRPPSLSCAQSNQSPTRLNAQVNSFGLKQKTMLLVLIANLVQYCFVHSLATCVWTPQNLLLHVCHNQRADGATDDPEDASLEMVTFDHLNHQDEHEIST